ncbi:MAG: glycerol-3-phosphate acyltransferase [Chloroflexi bacterium]|nr:glycerol-3-phosphate acyltransferase [Chloroflexota bacterium]
MLSDYSTVPARILVAHLIGGIPTAYLGGRIQRGIYIRQFGNGNAGTVNAVRTPGLRSGLLVLVANAAKSAAVIGIG